MPSERYISKEDFQTILLDLRETLRDYMCELEYGGEPTGDSYISGVGLRKPTISSLAVGGVLRYIENLIKDVANSDFAFTSASEISDTHLKFVDSERSKKLDLKWKYRDGFEDGMSIDKPEGSE